MKRQLYRYRHAAAIAATHKRSHSCKHLDTFQDFVQMLIASRCHGGGNSKYHSTENANEQINTKLQAQRKARKTQFLYIQVEKQQRCTVSYTHLTLPTKA